MSSTKYVQIQPCTDCGGMVAPCSTTDAAYFGVYLGEPGVYDWVADFSNVHDARSYAHTLATEHDASVVDLTKTI